MRVEPRGAFSARIHVEEGYDPEFLAIDDWDAETEAAITSALRAGDVVVSALEDGLQAPSDYRNAVVGGRWVIDVSPWTPRTARSVNAALLRARCSERVTSRRAAGSR